MLNFAKKLEVLANIAIVVVAVLLCVVLAKQYLLPKSAGTPTPSPAAHRISKGEKLSVPGVDWRASDRTLLMVLSSTCRYCTESAPFYQRLAQQKSGRADARLVAVLPQGGDEAGQYLRAHGISVDEIRQSDPGADYARATPTLIMVDNTGSVVESWVGKLPPEKEAEVARHLLGGSPGG